MDKPIAYDIGIVGDGCAAWMLLEALSRHEGSKELRILLIGSGEVLHRTWCFWEEDLPEPYRSMVHRSWSRMSFASGNINLTQTLEKRPYHYLPGEAFFRYFHEQFLPGHPNIRYVQQKVEQLSGTAGAFSVQVADQTYRCKQVYNSGITLRKPKIDLWQHFKGWVIALEEDLFDPEVVRLMDFNLSQEHGCAFMYLLPYSSRTALVEVTFFSSQPLPEATYELYLEKYIHENINRNYRILDQEFGMIPMQQGAFKDTGACGEINIGTLGGMVKPSTGYAWQRMREDSTQLAAAYFNGNRPKRKSESTRFAFYDSLLLWIITNKPQACKSVFTALFSRKRLSLITRFMDEKTRLHEEIGIFAVLPLGLFLKALWCRYVAGNLTKTAPHPDR